MRGCGNDSRCQRDDKGKFVVTPEPWDQILMSLPERYEGEALYDKVKNVTIGHFDTYYFKYYVKDRKPNLEQFKALYHDELIGYIRLANKLRDPEKKQLDPEGYMKRYWKRMEKFLRE